MTPEQLQAYAALSRRALDEVVSCAAARGARRLGPVTVGSLVGVPHHYGHAAIGVTLCGLSMGQQVRWFRRPPCVTCIERLADIMRPRAQRTFFTPKAHERVELAAPDEGP